MSIEYKGHARVLSAESKPYEVEGNKGISHRIRVMVDGEIYSAKSTEEQVREAKELEGKDVDVTLEFRSRKENLSLHIVELEEVV